MAEEVDPIQFELRALEYLSTGKDGEREAEWLAKAIQRESKLFRALARSWAEASNNAVGDVEIKRVLARMELVTAKSVGIPVQYLSPETKDTAAQPPP